MGDNTKIEWTDATWNPVTGCTEVSPGCDHCYAKTFAERWRGTPGHYFEHGFDIALRPERLDQPLRWHRPRRVFVNSMSDLFHADIPDDYIARVFAVMALTARHTYQLLTKRHARMRHLLASDDFRAAVAEHASDIIGHTGHRRQLDLGGRSLAGDSGIGGGWTVERTGTQRVGAFTTFTNLWSPPWPLPNVWVGVSVETQQWANIRIPALLGTPAAVRWLSCEPLLGPVNLLDGDHSRHARDWDGGDWICLDCSTDSEPVAWRTVEMPPIDWVVCGGESGPGARPMHPDWARSLRNQCIAADVPFFFKQWGEWRPLAGNECAIDGDTWPEGTYEAMSRKVGKKAAGRELDGRTWDEYPAVTT